MKVSCILLSAGKGERMGSEIPKQFIKFDGVPVIVHTLRVLDDCKRLDNIVIVMNEDYLEFTKSILKNYEFKKPIKLIKGGTKRQESTYNGLMSLKDFNPDVVVIHEAVRPFIEEEMIDETIDEAMKHGAVDVAVKTTDTMIQVVDGFITGMPDRNFLYNGLMPQTFKYEVIVDAHNKAIEDNFENTTDDVRLVHRLGWPVKVVVGSYDNKKLTTKEDIELFKKIYAARKLKI
ncbi:MAG: 2-C-methyl-D-erythritol 4-phosphate cytidylyltransferase [Eubacteriaceae bacterium]|nr:2-C-methyl-D-erythritol 4-phosphate cytidylyltransferase [Eubacteriaceae bacterium]